MPQLEHLVDGAEAAYGAWARSCIVDLRGPRQVLIGIVDGAGCWGGGLEAAARAREELLRRWRGEELSAARIADDLALVAEAIPTEGAEDFWSFSATFVRLEGGAAEIVGAGAYGVDLVTDAGTVPIFRPRLLVDEFTERRMLSAEELAAFPHQEIVLEPAVCSGEPVVPARRGPFDLPPGARLVVAYAALLRELSERPLPLAIQDARATQEVGASKGWLRRPVVVVRRTTRAAPAT